MVINPSLKNTKVTIASEHGRSHTNLHRFAPWLVRELQHPAVQRAQEHWAFKHQKRLRGSVSGRNTSIQLLYTPGSLHASYVMVLKGCQ